MPNRPKLKPCPFCGGRAYRRTVKWAGVPKFFVVHCTKCDVGTDCLRVDYKDAVEVWNRRVEGK